MKTNVKIGIIGLGYVGLPLALAFAKKFPGTMGFDVDESKLEAFRAGIDCMKEGFDEEIKTSSLQMTSSLEDLKACNFFVVTVPTPVDSNHSPDLSHVTNACEALGSIISKGSVIVFESTVYPGLTEEVCGPILERVSGLQAGRDYKLAYSPERVNPGDKEHTLQKIVKVVSGEDQETLDLVASVYGAIIEAGVHKASSIKVAEAAKVIENTQRDLNIALMNELALIFDRIGIPTHEVLEAAATKWNFHHFRPGLVGGHCIGVDPYYLTTKAEQLGYHPQVILAGRRINDGMGKFVAQKMVKLLVNKSATVKECRVGVMGITFKENVSDIRNSRVTDIVTELRDFGIKALVVDPNADEKLLHKEYGIGLTSLDELTELDGLIFAVPHREYLSMTTRSLCERLTENGVLVDVKSVLNKSEVPENLTYWSL